MPKPRARAAAEMMSELKLQAAASVTPVRATSCNAPSSARRPVPPKQGARTAAEVMIKRKLQSR